VILFAAVTQKSEPWDDLLYKVYLDHTESSTAFSSWNELEQALERFRSRRVFFHAEDPDVLKRTMGTGPGWRSRPPEAEVRAVEKILRLTDRFSLRSHVCHVSTRGAVELIEERNASSADRVTCEVTPHHIFFSVDDAGVGDALGERRHYGPLFDCNPPLRSEDDRVFLLDALKVGAIDALASDHAPHTLADKERGAPGMPHLDTLGAFTCWLVREQGFSPQRVSQIMAQGPNLICSTAGAPRNGLVTVGGDASFTVLDMDGHTIVDAEGIRGRGPFKTLCGWSPFQGVTFPGTVVGTLIRGFPHDVSGRLVDTITRC